MYPDGRNKPAYLGRGRPLFPIQHSLSEQTEVRWTSTYSRNFYNHCRKWNRLCVSYDFQKNQAQFAFGGIVSDLIIDPETQPNMNGGEDEIG